MVGMGVVPVVARLAVGELAGTTVNMNADTVAGAVAGALKAALYSCARRARH